MKDKHIISTRYNGAAAGVKDCLELGCIKDQKGFVSGTNHEICRAIHAEQNAIIQAAMHGKSAKGATIYCTHPPCNQCAKMIVNTGIVKFVTYGNYPDQTFMNLFKESGMEFAQVNAPQRIINVRE